MKLIHRKHKDRIAELERALADVRHKLATLRKQRDEAERDLDALVRREAEARAKTLRDYDRLQKVVTDLFEDAGDLPPSGSPS